ncbi:MAG: hypothetical protein D6701_02715 [Gemmatimonadetes bacterium]|nr:MAG: hypothetical protein D6701_02715 [Gemmatimonadota bacterium]
MVWAVPALAVLHFVLHVGFSLGAVAPDLLTVALLVAAREVRMGTAAGLGLLFGLLEDAYSVLSFGANAFALTVVGAAGARTRDLFVGDSLLFALSYMFFGTWARQALHWMVVGADVRAPFVQTVLLGAPLEAAYAAVVGAVVLWAFGSSWETVA